MTDTEHPRGQMVFQSHLTSPKSDEQVGALGTSVIYPKGWDYVDQCSPLR